jgi:shikimate kinase
MKKLYIAGPSGSGKTTLCKRLSEIENHVVHVSLDEEVLALFENVLGTKSTLEEHGQEFWKFSKKVLENLDRFSMEDIILLIDLDGGAAYIPECQTYLIEHGDDLIYIAAEPDIAYERQSKRAVAAGNPFQTKEEFVKLEYSEAMQRLYQSAAVTIDTTTDSIDTAVEYFRNEVIKKIPLVPQ